MRITVLGKSPSWQDVGGACSGYLVQESDFALLIEYVAEIPGIGIAFSTLLPVISAIRARIALSSSWSSGLALVTSAETITTGIRFVSVRSLSCCNTSLPACTI